MVLNKIRRMSVLKPLSPVRETSVDVLVVGADPCGLLSAIGLARDGFSVRIIDQRPEKALAHGMVSLAPQTIDILKSYHLADDIIEHATQIRVTAYHLSGKNGLEVVARVPRSSSMTGRSSSEMAVEQAVVERTLTNALAKAQVAVEHSVQLVSVELCQPDKGTTDMQKQQMKVTVRPNELKHEIIYAKYVIGADGIRSRVRDAVGISMGSGNTAVKGTEQVWSTIDFRPRTNFPDIHHFNVISTEHGGCLLMPYGNNKVRMVVQLAVTKDMYDPAGHLDLSQVSWKHILKSGQKVMQPYELESPDEPESWDVYRVRPRAASHIMAHDRVFLLGNSNHVVSPLHGQSINCGIGDAHNLIWKLSRVLRGTSSPCLLSTFESEREQFTRALVDQDRVIADTLSSKVKSAQEYAQVMERITVLDGFASGCTAQYETSSTITKHQTLAPNLTIGQPMPTGRLVKAADGCPRGIFDLLPADGRYKLFIFAGVLTDTKLAILKDLAELVTKPLLRSKESFSETFKTYVVSHGKEPVKIFSEVKAATNMEWSDIFVDVADAFTHPQGELFREFDVVSAGVAVVVRPDGYVGTLLPFNVDMAQELQAHFDKVLA